MRYLPVAGRKRLGFSGPGRSRSATEERALERSGAMAAGHSHVVEVRWSLRGAGAVSNRKSARYRGSTSQIFGGGAWERGYNYCQDDVSLNDIWIMY